MVMDRATFLARVNRHARLNRMRNISENILSDWLEAKLMPSPVHQGRLRIWTRQHYQCALEILRLNSQGIKNLNEIAWHLWIMGYEVPVFDNRYIARNVLCRAHSRNIRLAFDKVSSRYQPVRVEGAKEQWQGNVLLKSLGKLDSELEQAIKYERGELLDLYKIARFGETIGTAKDAIGRLFGNLAQRVNLQTLLPTDTQKSLLGMLMRSASDPREMGNSIEQSLRHASETEFRLARQAFRLISQSPWPFGPKAKRSFRTPIWRVSLFAFLVHAARTGGGTIMGLKEADLVHFGAKMGWKIQ